MAFGLLVISGLVAGIGTWAVKASLAGAVVAGGTVVVESNVKKVQHQSGGTVSGILVHNGDNVAAGDALVRFDDTVAKANLGIVLQELDRVRLRIARLETTAIGRADIILPKDLAARASGPDIRDLIAGETAFHESEMKLLAGKKAQLDTRSGQYREQIEGLKSQINAVDEALALANRDVVTVQDLYSRKLAPLDRLTALQTQIIQQKGEKGRLQASVAEVEGRISENALAKLQLDDDSRKTANAELRDTEAKEAELLERRQVAQDQLDHMTIRAPQTGIVQELSVHTVGGVVSPGETMMVIVPEADDLVIEAQIPPAKVDDVSIGQPVVIRFSAFDRNTTPECHGLVKQISPDSIKDPVEKTAYYLARINLTDKASCLRGSSRLLPGMPAELHIQTGDRTAWSYFMKPLTDQLARSFKE